MVFVMYSLLILQWNDLFLFIFLSYYTPLVEKDKYLMQLPFLNVNILSNNTIVNVLFSNVNKNSNLFCTFYHHYIFGWVSCLTHQIMDTFFSLLQYRFYSKTNLSVRELTICLKKICDFLKELWFSHHCLLNILF